MKICVISDIHGSDHATRKIKEIINEFDYAIFSGDGEKDFLEIEKSFKGKTFKVRGNGDTNVLKEEEIFKIENFKILLVHGHRHIFAYDDFSRLINRAKEEKVDIIIYGHTHVFNKFEKDGMIFFNSGSPSLPRMRKIKTVGVIEIIEGKAYFDWIEIKK